MAHGDWAFWDGHNILLVIFLIVILVGLSCGLLAYICHKMIEDAQEEGGNPSSFLLGRRMMIQQSELMTNAPTKIIVTGPTDYSQGTTPDPHTPRDPSREINGEVKRSGIGRLGSARKIQPKEKILYSAETSPLNSPIQKFFVWSKNSNYDLRQDSLTRKDNESLSGSDRSDKSGKSLRAKRKKRLSRGNSSPLAVYNHFQARVHSAPHRPVLSRQNSFSISTLHI